ncbi:MAG TPA: hypothetical protein VMG60_12925 [Burkholderiaceae bacterium]|nr:hypothetical protein [Burkholderiaceae bacterium]
MNFIADNRSRRVRAAHRSSRLATRRAMHRNAGETMAVPIEVRGGRLARTVAALLVTAPLSALADDAPSFDRIDQNRLAAFFRDASR